VRGQEMLRDFGDLVYLALHCIDFVNVENGADRAASDPACFLALARGTRIHPLQFGGGRNPGGLVGASSGCRDRG
jgi:hypothetical protein